MGRRRFHVVADRLPMKSPFAISGYVFHDMPAVVALVSEDGVTGRGEAAGVYYFNEGAEQMAAALEGVRGEVEAGLDREALQRLLPPGGARNALDCALWELEAALAGREVWELAGLPPPKPLLTTMTAGAAEPAAMVEAVRAFPTPKALKLKLTGEPELDVARVQAVRAAEPGVWLGVDANQGYSLEALQAALPGFAAAEVSLVEQPLPRGREAELDGFVSPIPLAADESVQSGADLAAMEGRFQVINIKLDKCGGLTEGLAMAAEARRMGFGLMVGNMAGSSWAMAAASVVGQLCEVVDLDGPLALSRDREPAVTYREGLLSAGPEVWGRGVTGDPAAYAAAIAGGAQAR
jgi:L-alanine-DL-glutamate epimerase-like enolase superfamily enzyme